MALINCPECGKEVSDKADKCINCGCPISEDIVYEDDTSESCPKCGGKNIIYQREQSTSIGGQVHSFNKTSGHGCLYWLLFGWWVWIFKLIWETIKFLCTCGLSLLFRKKKSGEGGGHSITASKTINRTMAVCQKCGYSWKA